jgi:hypothetical protein
MNIQKLIDKFADYWRLRRPNSQYKNTQENDILHNNI